MYEYYVSFTEVKGRFRANAMGQDIFDYAQRRDAPMPWTSMYYTWTTSWPSMKEYKAGAASPHDKWWDETINLDPKQKERPYC